MAEDLGNAEEIAGIVAIFEGDDSGLQKTMANVEKELKSSEAKVDSTVAKIKDALASISETKIKPQAFASPVEEAAPKAPTVQQTQAFASPVEEAGPIAPSALTAPPVVLKADDSDVIAKVEDVQAQLNTIASPPPVVLTASTAPMTTAATAAQATVNAAVQTTQATAATAVQATQATATAALNNTAAQTGGVVNTIKSQLASLKATSGRASTLTQGLKVLQGAGAAIGVSLLGNELAAASGKAAELADQMRRGEVGAAGMTVGLLESLPIIGGFATAGANIREIFTGEKAAIEDMNKSIALGNSLLESRERTAEQTKSALRSLIAESESFADKQTLAGAKNEVEKKKIEIDIQYSGDTRRLDESTQRSIEQRRKELQTSEEEIGKRFEGKNKPQDQQAKNQLIQSAQGSASRDIDKITEASKQAQAAMDQWHTGAVADAGSIKDKLRELADTMQNKLAVTDNEKLKAFSDELLRAGYSADQAKILTAKFGDSLKADKLAQFKTDLLGVQTSLKTLADTARQTKLNEAILNGANPAQLKAYAAGLDEIAAKTKIQQLHEQTSGFGRNPLEQLKASAEYKNATPDEQKVLVGLTVKVTGQEKLQAVFDKVKELKDQADSFGTTPLERMLNSKEYKNATPDEKKQLVTLTLKIEGQEKAQELHDKLKQIGDDAKYAGESDLRKQVDQLAELARKAGAGAGEVGKLKKALQELQETKVKNFIRDENEETAEVGLSEPDKAVQKLKSEGVTDPKLLGDAWTAAAKKAGAELRQSVETPFEKYSKEIRDLNQLKDAGAIDKNTYDRAKRKDTDEALNSMKGVSVEDAFADNLRKQLAGQFLLQNVQKDDPTKALADNTKDAAKKTEDNTKAVINLTGAFKGITGQARYA